MRVALIIPSALNSLPKDTFYTFLLTYSHLLDRLEDLPFTITRLEIKAPPTFPIDANRNMAVAEILEQGFDTSIWFDADQTFPQNMLFRLLQNPAPIVSGMYFLKKAPFFPIVYKETKDSKKSGKFNWFTPIMEYPKEDFFNADMIGMGCVKIDRIVFEKIAQMYSNKIQINEAVNRIKKSLNKKDVDKIKPYLDNIMDADHIYGGSKPEFFRYGINPITIDEESFAREPLNKYRTKYCIRDATEDVFFWKQVKQAGFEILIDPKIQCGHITNIISDQDLFHSFYQTRLDKIKIDDPKTYNTIQENICRAEPIKNEILEEILK